MSEFNEKKSYPRISIVTISFNQAEFIEETISSILNQKYPDLEYIIIDGGSNDNTIDIIKKYDKSITYWVSEKDSGPAEALKKGLDRATGEILFYLNSDDLILPDSLEKVASFFSNNPHIDVLIGNGYMIDENSKIIKPIYSNKWNLNRYLNGYVSIVQQSTFFRKHAYDKTQGVNIINKTCWDGEMWVDMDCAKAKFMNFNVSIGLFRIHQKSITGSQKLNDKYLIDQDRIKKRFKLENKYFSLLKSIIIDFNIWALRLKSKIITKNNFDL